LINQSISHKKEAGRVMMPSSIGQLPSIHQLIAQKKSRRMARLEPISQLQSID